MKFSKTYIKQIIEEEIKNATDMAKKLKSKKNNKLEKLRHDLIKLFIDHRQKITSMASTSKKLARKELESDLEEVKDKYGLDHLNYPKFFVFCVHILNGSADPQLVTFIKTLAMGDRRFGAYQDKLDSYGHSITPEEEKYQPAIRKDPDPGFMRVPKTDNAVDDQEDLYRDRKTLVKAENYQLDEGMKEVFKELSEFAKFLYTGTKKFLQWSYEEAKREIAKMNLTHEKATKAMQEWKAMKKVKILFEEDPEVKALIEAGKPEEASHLMITKGNLSLEDQSLVKKVYSWMRNEYLTGQAELSKLKKVKTPKIIVRKKNKKMST